MAIYFYKADAPYGCFSNFSPHPITLEGVFWLTVEHFYQSRKFVGTPAATETIALIQRAVTPDAAAQLGRDPMRALRPDWDQVKWSIMYGAVWTKFQTHSDLATVLLNTEDQEIIEDSPRDYYWGCGADRTGQNQLGKILMQIRDRLRQPEPPPPPLVSAPVINRLASPPSP